MPTDKNYNQPISIGRIVHYVMPDNQHRPAIIVRVWENNVVNLQVFLDSNNDHQGNGKDVIWRTSVHQDEGGISKDVGGEVHEVAPKPNTWHYPERI